MLAPLWKSSALMEWAKGERLGTTTSLARSAVPKIQSLSEIPGGPYQIRLSSAGDGPYGHQNLRAQIAQMYDASFDEVLVAQGASQANFLLAGALLEQGGTAIVETPVYEPVFRGIEMLATRVMRLPRHEKHAYLPDPAELRALLTDDTKLVWLTNLHNPTQREMEPSLVQALAAECERVGASLIVDEVYLTFVRADHRSHGFTYGAVSVNSLDKAWGLDSLRVGWAVGPKKVIERAYRFNNLLGVNQPYVTEDLADQILRSPQALEWFRQRRQTSVSQMALLTQFLRSVPFVEIIPPSGGVNACLILPEQTDDRVFVERLQAEHGVTVFPCSFFELPGCIRVSVGCDPVVTRQHLGLLGVLLREYAS